MKATIHDLFDTCRRIIAFDDSEFERPKSFDDLSKCENVLVGKKIDGPNSPTEVMIDNQIYLVKKVKIQHPSGGGTMFLLEVF